MREIRTRATRGGDPDKLGRSRAEAMYPIEEPCEVCGKSGKGRGVIDRHHRDSDRSNNVPGNIAFLCRKHHQAAHRLTDGKVGGGPRPRITALSHERGVRRAHRAWEMRSGGSTVAEIARDLGVSVESVPRYFRDPRYLA